jgi:heme exporter protein D
MYFHSWAEFWQMGQQGLYVWSTYGVALVILLWNVLCPLYKLGRLMRSRTRLLKRQGAQITVDKSP